MNRADRLTPRTKQLEYYSDFLINLDRNPISGELARATNERAIIRSLKALILTNIGERPFEPTVGSSIRDLLFEPMDVVTADLIKEAITICINLHEPRVTLQQVSVVSQEENNAYYVTIVFAIVNAPSQSFSFSTVLKRVR